MDPHSISRSLQSRRRFVRQTEVEYGRKHRRRREVSEDCATKHLQRYCDQLKTHLEQRCSGGSAKKRATLGLSLRSLARKYLADDDMAVTGWNGNSLCRPEPYPARAQARPSFY